MQVASFRNVTSGVAAYRYQNEVDVGYPRVSEHPNEEGEEQVSAKVLILACVTQHHVALSYITVYYIIT